MYIIVRNTTNKRKYTQEPMNMTNDFAGLASVRKHVAKLNVVK